MRIILSAIGLASLLTAGAVVNRNGLTPSHPLYVTEIPSDSSGSAVSPENTNGSSTPSVSSSSSAPLPAQPTLLDQVAVRTNTGVITLPVGTVVEVVEDYGPNVIVFWNGHRFWLYRGALVRALESRSLYERIAGTFVRRETKTTTAAPKTTTATKVSMANNSQPTAATIKKTAGVERSSVPPTAQAKTWTPSPTMLSPRASSTALTGRPSVVSGNVPRTTVASPIVRPTVTAPVTRSAPVGTTTRTVVEGPIIR